MYACVMFGGLHSIENLISNVHLIHRETICVIFSTYFENNASIICII